MTALPFLLDDRAAAIEQLHAQTALYTNHDVVDALLAHLRWPDRAKRLIDPSCGDGMFLERALRLLLRSQTSYTPTQIAHVIEGWEIHPDAAAQARDRVAATLLAHGWTTADAAAAAAGIVRNRDFLTEGPTERGLYDVIATNPPYLRSANVPPLLREEYAALSPTTRALTSYTPSSTAARSS